MANKAGKAFSKLTMHTKKSNSALSRFGNTVKQLALSMVVFQVISKTFNAMVESIKSGIQNYAKYSDKFNESMSAFKTSLDNLKNSAGAAAMPIVNALLPGITALCDGLTRAANFANQLFSTLAGKTTWSKAVSQQKDYAKSLDKTAGAAKKTAGALASFDDLNILQKDCNPQAHVVYTRRYKVDLRSSVFNQFMKTVIRYHDLENWDFKQSPMCAVYKPTGQMVMFAGADKPISLKSFNVPFGYVKMLIHEECDEMAGVEQMDNIEDTFLRADTPALDIKIFNPPKSKNNFMNEYTEECQNKPQTRICHSYYYNVPVKWLGKRFFERAEWFRIHKPLYYKNNYLGEVTGTGGGIFDNLEIRKISDEELMTFDLINHGLDFGYTHPQVFSQNYYDYETDTLYIFGEVYSKKCKNSTFARKIKKFMNVEIICDSARPDGIAEMQDWGFNAIGAKKRWGSGKGRDYCWEWLQRCNKIVIDPERCPNTEKEFIKAEHEQLPDGSFSDAYPDLEEDTIMANIYALNRIIMTSRRNDGLYDDDVEEETVWNEKNV